MSTLMAMAVPILPGKTEQWRNFANALKGEKKQAHMESRKKLGVRERAFLQQTPMGDMVIVTLEGENPQEAFAKFGQGTDEFTQWFAKEVKEIHGFDLNAPPPGPMPELIVDSGKIVHEMA